MLRMKNYFLLLLAVLIPLYAPASEEHEQIMVHNRILARIGDTVISVLDVVKKMDVYLARNYPQLSQSPISRYQFFTTNWRHVLSQMIDNELILADAKQVQLKISDAEVREALYERFGPNMMPSLDALGISYDEAWQMIYSEMAVQRMSYFRVHSKALQRIGPNDIKAAYKKFLNEHPPTKRWKYQLLSIRTADQTAGSALAQKAYQLLSERIPISQVADQLKMTSGATIQLSEEQDVVDKDLSEPHKKVLLTLQPGNFSIPMTQISRIDQNPVHRIFFLKDYQEINPPPFKELADKLHDELVQNEINKEMPVYLSRLRRRFNVDDLSVEPLPSNFQPFSLK